MIEVVCNMQIDFLIKERKYKQAFEAAQTLLHYNKNGIKNSKYAYNANYWIYK